MVATTIQIDSSTRDKLAEFKMPGETFNDLLLRLYKSANERLLEDVLMDSTNCVSIDDAIKLAEDKWQK